MPRRPLRPCRKTGCPNLTREGWCDEHKDFGKKRDEKGRGSSAKRGYGYGWRQIREKHLAENPYCEVCGELAAEVDHRVRRADGGTDEPENLQSLCKTHHSQKTGRERRG